MKTVYWCPVIKNDNLGVDELKIYEPESVIKTINPKDFFGLDASRCPAIVDEIKNTFSIRSPIDFHINYDAEGDIISNSPYDQQFLANYLGQPNPEKVHQIQ